MKRESIVSLRYNSVLVRKLTLFIYDYIDDDNSKDTNSFHYSIHPTNILFNKE